MIVLILFLIFSRMFTPLDQFYPQATSLIQTYVIILVVFIILGELAKGTIFQYGLNMGRAFFFVGYTIYALNSGTITETIQSVTFTVNLEIFLMMMILIGTLDFAKSLVQLINHMATKAETEEITVPALEQEVIVK